MLSKKNTNMICIIVKVCHDYQYLLISYVLTVTYDSVLLMRLIQNQTI